MTALRTKVHLSRTSHGRIRLMDAPPAETAPPRPPRVPRIARLMALAIRFDRLLRDGSVASLSELARLTRITQPRVTQILNLTLLAPDIQDELLHLGGAEVGRDRINERMLRPIAAHAVWVAQRSAWRRAVQLAGSGPITSFATTTMP